MAARIHPNDPPWTEEPKNSEVITGVTVDEINELLMGAHLVEWNRVPRATLIMWMEEAAFVFDRLLGRADSKPFEGHNDAAY